MYIIYRKNRHQFLQGIGWKKTTFYYVLGQRIDHFNRHSVK